MALPELPLILALDIGSTSVRSLVFDLQGRPVEGLSSRRPVRINVSADGVSELEPRETLDLVFDCLDELQGRIGQGALPPGGRVEGVAPCTFVTNLVGLDAKGRPLTPLSTYADTSAEEEAARLRTELDETEVHDRTGCRLHPSYLPARLRRWAGLDPGLFRRVGRWASLGEYLELTLFGQTKISLSAASWTGLLDRRRLVWDRPLLETLGLTPERFSALAALHRPRQGLKPEYARRWPALARAAWFPALGDGAAANIGSGCLGPDRVALTLGTSTALRAVMEAPAGRVPPGLFCYRVDHQSSLLGGALTEGGGLYDWCRRTFNLPEGDRLQAVLQEMEPDSHGLAVLPFWSGERAPGWAGQARGSIAGLSLATEPVQILRAVMEAVALRLAAVHRLLSPFLNPDHILVASGGALTNSPVWLGIMADTLGRPVEVPDLEEATARGAALLAFRALGRLDDLSRTIPPPLLVREPDPERHLLYQRAGEEQEKLYCRLIGPLKGGRTPDRGKGRNDESK